MLFLILLFQLAFTLNYQPFDRSVIVHTDKGGVEGYSNSKGIVFKGIPFALPPLGNLRFSKPQPITSWNKTLD